MHEILCSMCGKDIPPEATNSNGDLLFTMGRMRFCSIECKEGKRSIMSDKMKQARSQITSDTKKQKGKKNPVAVIEETVMPETMKICEYMGFGFRYRWDKDGNLHMIHNESGLDAKIPKDCIKQTVIELSYMANTMKE